MNDQFLDSVARANAFMLHNHITARQTGDGTADAVLTVVPDSLNPYGMLHGGAYYTMADCAAGTACRTDGRKYVTLDGGIHFLKAARPGDTVTAAAAVRHRGRTTSLADVTITDQDGRLLATGSFTFFCLGELTEGDLNLPR